MSRTWNITKEQDDKVQINGCWVLKTIADTATGRVKICVPQEPVVGDRVKYYFKNRVSYPALWHIIGMQVGFVRLEKTGRFPDRKWITKDQFRKDYFVWIGGPNEDDRYYPR